MIWRAVSLDDSTSVHYFCLSMQVALGWTSLAPYTLTIDDTSYGCDTDLETTMHLSSIPISSFLTFPGQRMSLERDMDAVWTYDIEYSAILEQTGQRSYPHCIAGEGLVPSDEFGGMEHFRDFVEGQRSSDATLRNFYCNWARELDADPDLYFNPFDINDINERLLTAKEEWAFDYEE
jgi:hypothetical protein